MKKIFFFALLSAFTLITTSCNKDDATEMVDKTEYKVIILVQGYSSSPKYTYEALEDATIKFLDYDKTYTTDKDGKATLTLQQGEYRIAVTHEDYNDYYLSSSYDNIASFEGKKYFKLDVEGNTTKVVTLWNN
jgi:hypothetical protein